MTLRANPLMTSATASMIPSRGIRAFIEALTCMGFSRDTLISAAGIEASTVSDPDQLVPARAINDLVCFAEQHRIPNLGLRIACATPLGSFPLLDYLAVTSDAAGEAIRVVAGYLPIAGSPAIFKIDETADPIRVSIDGSPFTVEYTVALVVRHLRDETNGRFVPEFVSFAHDMSDPSEFQQRLGCAVRVADGWSGLVVSRQAWQVPMRRRDPILRDLLRKQADEVRVSSKSGGDVVDEVNRAIMSRIGRDTTIRRIASDLNMTPRTLQRRLGAVHTSFESVRESVIRQMAERCLATDQLSIGEIAYLLGYSEPAAFHRAFKRWTKKTPQAFRAAQQQR